MTSTERGVTTTLVARDVRRAMLAALTLVFTLAPSVAAGQTAGTLSVGVAITQINPTSDELGGALGIGPIVRSNPRRGWGVDFALNWFRVNLNPDAPAASRAALTVRPVMLGASYTIGPPTTLVSFSIVAGPSLDSVDFSDTRERDTFEIGIVTRPGVTVTQSLARRVGIVAFAGYLVHRRGALLEAANLQRPTTWNADAVVLSVGAVYSLF